VTYLANCMIETEQLSDSAPFRDQKWNAKWLVIGLAFLALCQCVRFLDRQWMLQWPILYLLALGLAPQLFMWLFPILTRNKEHARRIQVPGFKRCLIELAIAVPIVLVTLLALAGLDYLVQHFFPGKSLQPDLVPNMAYSSPGILYLILLFSFLVTPVAEEVFFRGFMYNVFRRWMPRIVAVVVQSLIFGFSHFFGTSHAIYAVAVGIVLTLLYEWRKTLVSPIFVHAGINFLAAIGTLVMMAQYAEGPVLGVMAGPDTTACIVSEVVPNSAAFEAGIKIGDRVLTFDGQPIANFPELKTAISSRRPGDTVIVTLVRQGKPLVIKVTLKRRGPPKSSRVRTGRGPLAARVSMAILFGSRRLQPTPRQTPASAGGAEFD
jgi:membrane protease YdiL (CAAX protease family)